MFSPPFVNQRTCLDRSCAAFFFPKAFRSFFIWLSLGPGALQKSVFPLRKSWGGSLVGAKLSVALLLIIGLLTRLAAIVLRMDISVAIASTKIPVLLGHGFWGLSLSKLPRYGFWGMMHEARTDFSMWLGLLFLLIVGAGKKWSVDSDCAAKQRLN